MCKDSRVQYKRKIYKRNICWAYPRHFSSKHYFNTNKRGVNIRVINYQGAPVIIYWSLNDHRESYDHLEDKVGLPMAKLCPSMTRWDSKCQCYDHLWQSLIVDVNFNQLSLSSFCFGLLLWIEINILAGRQWSEGLGNSGNS